MKKYLIVCGHGQGDPGATGNGYKEADLVRKIGPVLVKELNKIDGVKADLYDTSKDLFQQGNIYNISKNYDEVIELHMNAFSGSAYGSEVLVFLGGEDAIDKACKAALAEFFYDRGFKDGSWVYNANNCACAYRLLEIGFIDNKNDAKIFNDKYSEIAKSIAKRIAKAYGYTYNNSGSSNSGVSVHYYSKVAVDKEKEYRYYNPNYKYVLKIDNSWKNSKINMYSKFENGKLSGKYDNSGFQNGQVVESTWSGWTNWSEGKDSNGKKFSYRYGIHKITQNQYGKTVYFAYKKETKY